MSGNVSFKVKMRNLFSDYLLLFMTLSGVFFGIVIGIICRNVHMDDNNYQLLTYPGEIFMRILKQMILPMIVSSLISGSASLNAKVNGKIAIRTFFFFLLTSLFNAFLGICLALAIHPGNPGMNTVVESKLNTNNQISVMDSLLDLGRNLIPDNLFQAAFQQAHTVYIPNETNNSSDSIIDKSNNIPGVINRVVQYRSGTNTIGIAFFCLCFGTVVGTLGERGKVIIDFFSAVFEVIMQMLKCVMWFTSIGIASLIAGKIASASELSLILSQLGWFIATVTIGVLFYQLIVLQLIYFIVVRKNPYKYYWGLMEATLTASATASTAATLPITFQCLTEKLKIDPRIIRFVLPIGCNINMDGTALFVAVASIFIAQMNGIYLGFGKLSIVLLTSTLASFSSASVPSAALVLILVVLSAIDVPSTDVSLLFAIDWLVDRIRTTNNMLGDCYAAAVVERLSQKELMRCDELLENKSFNRHLIPVIVENGERGEAKYNKAPPSPDTDILEMDLIVENEKKKEIKV